MSQDGILHLNQNEKRRVGKLVGRVKTVTEFLSGAVEKVKDVDFPDAIAQAAPWAETVVGAAADAAGEVVPPIKFLVKLFENLTAINDPEELGHLACTVAFERAAEQAIKEVGGPAGERRAISEAKEQLSRMEPSEEVDLGAFTYDRALDHEFFKRAEVQLQTALILVGYGEQQVNLISDKVKDTYVNQLKTLLAHRDTAEKFAPFKEYIELGGAGEKAAYKALAEHLKLQRWLFEEAPVLRKSPFALRHVYVETDCGKLAWGDITPPEAHPKIRHAAEDQTDERKSKDPFSEQDGGRQPLLQTVLDLIAEGGSREPIIIQGVAGTGKSSFTLRLCVALQRRQLRPVLIRFKDIRFDLRHIKETLPQAVRLYDEQQQLAGAPPQLPGDLFRGGNIFRESGSGVYSGICRYVLIFDGWDEISVANEGFKKRVERILEQIRNEYIDNNTLPLPVRVIMTGRPSADVNESGFLRETTPILTLRPFTPPQLRGFVQNLSEMVRARPVTLPDEGIWAGEFDCGKFDPIFSQYEADFERLMSNQAAGADEARTRGSLGVLGLPLLAQLAARLISSWPGEPEQLISNPTTLYRNLVNLTCETGGKVGLGVDEVAEIREQSRVVGSKLRGLLWKTASAMTAYGKDLIPYDELSSRLYLEGEELDDEVSSATRESTLSALLISFYFKGGFRHAGCEFVHKSFREYLFAEALVETIKEYGRPATGFLPERDKYWKEFGKDDPRHQFSRDLARLFPQWLNPEVASHVDHLLEWEVRRATDGLLPQEAGTTTRPLGVEGWRRVRDGLADLWDWWGEGVHLRPQPTRGTRRELRYEEPFVSELIQNSLPRETASATPVPPRTTVVDSHLGYALLTLCVLCHHHLPAVGADDQNPPAPGALRRYQSQSAEGIGKVRFAPSKPSREYFKNYAYRIASAGLRPNGWFPDFSDLRSVDLSGTDLFGLGFYGARFDHADLRTATLTRADLYEASFIEADLSGAALEDANLQRAVLSRANLSSATLLQANLFEAKLDGANLSNAHLGRSLLARATLREANLSGATVYSALLYAADLTGAELRGAMLDGANLEYANCEGAVFNETRLSGANLSEARLMPDQIANAFINDTTKLPDTWADQSARLKDPSGAG